jgi:hypothetical protein
MRLRLPQITLCAFGSTNIDGMRRALDYSSKDIDFGDVKLIEHECDGIDEWNKHIVFELGSYIKTPFALLIHPDGFVVHPESWKDKWLEYDYIGSPWALPSDDYSYRDVNGKIQRVGNSVSLRSKKLLDLPKKVDMEWRSFHGFYNEDGYISCNMRHIFEQHGCKFAPFEEAVFFGRETPLPENVGINPFVFHRHMGENNKYPNFE